MLTLIKGGLISSLPNLFLAHRNWSHEDRQRFAMGGIVHLLQFYFEESWLMGWGLTDGFTSFSRQTAKLCTNLSFVMEQTAA